MLIKNSKGKIGIRIVKVAVVIQLAVAFLTTWSCSGKSDTVEVKSEDRNIGYIEFKLDNVLYKINADSLLSAGTFKKPESITISYGENYPPQVSTLEFEVRKPDTLKLGKYTISSQFDFRERSLQFVYVGRGMIFNGGTTFGDSEIEFTKLDRNRGGVIEGTFSIKKVRVEQGNKITSENSTLTDGKFRIRKDWDSGW